jgi:hypothetical protein
MCADVEALARHAGKLHGRRARLLAGAADTPEQRDAARVAALSGGLRMGLRLPPPAADAPPLAPGRRADRAYMLYGLQRLLKPRAAAGPRAWSLSAAGVAALPPQSAAEAAQAGPPLALLAAASDNPKVYEAMRCAAERGASVLLLSAAPPPPDWAHPWADWAEVVALAAQLQAAGAARIKEAWPAELRKGQYAPPGAAGSWHVASLVEEEAAVEDRHVESDGPAQAVHAIN